MSKIIWPTLYARTNTGAIQTWWITQDKENYYSTSGQIDGVKTASSPTTAQGKNIGKKNETTPEEQATLEIQAKYDKQLKSGGYWENIKDIDQDKFFQVMLAKNFSDYEDKINWGKGVAVQIKYNGGRILARKSGTFTRKGEKYEVLPHIEKALEPFFNKYPDAILDGEGFNYELREKLNEIMTILRKTVHVTSEDIQKSKELIKFYIYDGFGFPAQKDGALIPPSFGYLERKLAINNTFFTSSKDRYNDVIGYVPTFIVYSKQDLNKLYFKFLEDKQEGAIIRILDQPYENKRSKFLLKYKPVDDAEYKIIEVHEGEGNWSGRLAKVTCQRIDGKSFLDQTDTFNATFKGTEDEAFSIWKKDKGQSLIGKVVTIYFNGLTGYFKPNYARFDYNNYIKS